MHTKIYKTHSIRWSGEKKSGSRHHKGNQLTNQKNRFKWKQKNTISILSMLNSQSRQYSKAHGEWDIKKFRQTNKKKSKFKEEMQILWLKLLWLGHAERWSHKTHAQNKQKTRTILIHSSHFLFFVFVFLYLSLLFILSGTPHIFLQLNDDDGGGGDFFSVFFLCLSFDVHWIPMRS